MTGLLLGTLPEGARAAVLEELREEPGRLEQAVAQLQAWYRRQPHLPQPADGLPFDEQLCRVFLRGCKHDLERSKRKLDAYFSARTAVPALFQRRDPRGPRLQRIMDILHIVPLPRSTAGGHRITLHHVSHTLLKEVRAQGGSVVPPLDIAALGQYMFLVGEVRMREELDPVAGDIFIFDFTGFGTAHCAQVIAAAAVVRDGMVAVQEAFPQRVHAIHLLGMHPAMDKLVAFIKAFMKEKVRNRFHTHASLESLHKQVAAELLPREYGGSLDRDLAREWRRKLESYGPWALAQDSLLADESRRPARDPAGDAKSCAAAQMFGCEGSFRRLAID